MSQRRRTPPEVLRYFMGLDHSLHVGCLVVERHALHHEVSVKTVRRDIEMLRAEFGVRIDHRRATPKESDRRGISFRTGRPERRKEEYWFYEPGQDPLFVGSLGFWLPLMLKDLAAEASGNRGVMGAGKPYYWYELGKDSRCRLRLEVTPEEWWEKYRASLSLYHQTAEYPGHERAGGGMETGG
jgi:hypothetical protein